MFRVKIKRTRCVIKANFIPFDELLLKLKDDMLNSAGDLEFEKAAILRDQMIEVERKIKLLERKK